MSRVVSPRRIAAIAFLTAAWCALWGSVTGANVVSGAVLATVVVSARLGGTPHGGVRVLPLLRLGLLVTVDLIRSTFAVGLSILSPANRISESIIAVHLGPESRDHLLLIVCAVTLTPGTAVVETDVDTGVIYLHVMHSHDADDVRAHVQELATLARKALPLGSTGPVAPTGGRS